MLDIREKKGFSRARDSRMEGWLVLNQEAMRMRVRKMVEQGGEYKPGMQVYVELIGCRWTN